MRPADEDPPDEHPGTAESEIPEDELPRPSRSNLRVVSGARPGSRSSAQARPASRSALSSRPGVRQRPASDEDPEVGHTRMLDTSGADDDSVEGENEGPPDNEATHAGPPITIEVIEGADAGRKKRVRGGRMVVGRGDGCDLKLRDTASSRRHLEIIVGMSGSIVRDLGSGNGTKVNGQKIDEAQVGHGDEIMVGTTILKVIDEIAALEERRRPKQPEPPPDVEPADEEEPIDDEAPPPRRGAPPRRDGPTGAVSIDMHTNAGQKRGGGIIIFAIVAVALVLGGVLVMLLRPPGPAKPLAPQPSDTQLADLMKDGKAALQAADFDKANADWDELTKLDPTNSDVSDLRERTKKEKEAKENFMAAEGMIAEHRYDDARDKLKAVWTDSVLVGDKAADELKNLDKQQSDYLAGQAALKVQSGDLDGARALLPKLQSMDTGKADQVQKLISDRQSAIDNAALKNIKNKKQRERMMKELKKRKADESTRQELASGFRKFQEANSPGGFDRAANEFQRISESTNNPAVRTRARDLAGKVRSFSKNMEDADGLDNDQNYEAEVAPLDKALSALEDIEPTGPLMSRIKNRMVRGLVIKGRNAAARQDYALAAKAFNKALQIKPGEPTAKEGLTSLHARAQDVYLQAYEEEARDAESARKLYHAVMDMTSPSEELYQKAKKRLEHPDN
ncbi:MAG: FHA domain-containing protein [Deltaproteobacteria bacterium]|nr:FHA domain-containing protein [Deltaproteobacteria bacterium]